MVRNHLYVRYDMGAVKLMAVELAAEDTAELPELI